MFLPWFERLLRAAPSVCQVCARWPAEPVCSACTTRFAMLTHRCRCCAIEVPANVPICGRCLRDPPPLAGCFAAVTYGYPWSGLLGRYKFQDEPGWAHALAGLLRATAGVDAALESCDVLVPMPLSKQRLASRGFNQALELARCLAPGKADASLLLRLRDTPPQAALGRKERLANVKHAFAADPLQLHKLRGRRIALVDDVMTSGASLFTAAAELRAAGCDSVVGLVIARTDETR